MESWSVDLQLFSCLMGAAEATNLPMFTALVLSRSIRFASSLSFAWVVCGCCTKLAKAEGKQNLFSYFSGGQKSNISFGLTTLLFPDSRGVPELVASSSIFKVSILSPRILSTP